MGNHSPNKQFLLANTITMIPILKDKSKISIKKINIYLSYQTVALPLNKLEFPLPHGNFMLRLV